MFLRYMHCLLLLAFILVLFETASTQDEEPLVCMECHEPPAGQPPFSDQLETSVHAGFDCIACHIGKDELPHDPMELVAGSQGCRGCHSDVAEIYVRHGFLPVGETPDVPTCSDCHGAHGILSIDNPLSLAYPGNVASTCAECHADVNLVQTYNLVENTITIWRTSVHSEMAGTGEPAASCIACHGVDMSAHRILNPGEPESPINHFNIPATCGACHTQVAEEYAASIHGELAARGETDVPVCTNCHGEHGVLAPTDPSARVAPSNLAGQTCAPCHESVELNERYGLMPWVRTSFVDSYHGLKSQAGDVEVANCASCHGVHKILPSNHPQSSVNPDNLQETCGECHPEISAEMAQMPIHGIGGQGLRTDTARIIEDVYLIAIFIIIGLMVLHWLVDLGRHLYDRITEKPAIRRMIPNEVWQHTILMVSFIVLVISGFALRYEEAWWTELLFGFEGGFALRGLIHRAAAIVFCILILWHVIFLIATRRGREYWRDMLPRNHDFRYFFQRLGYNLGLRREVPASARFTYVQKAEYWALVWGSAVMVISGFMLWFDNTVINWFPKGALDIAWVVHFYEAWLATLAIVVWHFYSTIFDPKVYPMNPSWLTGKEPEAIYAAEHREEHRPAPEETQLPASETPPPPGEDSPPRREPPPNE